jgi:hypothetical protein
MDPRRQTERLNHMQPSRFPGIDDQLDELVAQNQGARADRVQPTSSRYPAIDQHLGEMQRSERLAVENTLDLALPRNPDKAAEAQTLADRFRLDMATVQAKQDELARIARGEDIRKALVSSPILRRQMTDMKFAEIAHDDVETLSGIESVMTAIKNTPRAMLGGLQSASAGVVGAAQVPFDVLDPVGELFSGTVLPENPLRRVSRGLGDFRKWIDKQSEANMPKGSGNIESGYYSGMASLSRNVATLPLLFLPGGQNATLTGMVAPVVGEEFGNARDAGLTPTQSLVFGASQGSIEWAFEKIPVAKLLGDLKAGETFFKTLGKQVLYEAPLEQATTILQDLNTWAAIDINNGKTINDYLAERPDAAVQTLVATLVGTGGQVSVVKAVDAAIGRIAFKEERAAAAEQHAAALAQMGEMVKASKALARSPQSVAQFVQEAAKEQGAENVYVDAKVFNQLVQDTGAVLPGPLRDQLAEATARGGDVVIPVGTFATEVASTEYGAALADHVKLDPNGMSRAEAVEFMATQGEQLQQEVERTLTQQESSTAFQASREAVQSQIQQELDTLGRFTPEKNAADAVLFASYYATRAAQLGVTPEALFDQRRVRFAAEAVAGQQFQQVAIDTPEFSNWFGDSKVVDSAGKPLVVYHGAPDLRFLKEDGTFKSQKDRLGFGRKDGAHWFTPSLSTAKSYADPRRAFDYQNAEEGTVATYLKMENPLIVDGGGQNWRDAQKRGKTSDVIEEARNAGHDGVIIRNVKDDYNNTKSTKATDTYVVFDSKQIKSATGNRGTFDPNDPNILNQPSRGSFGRIFNAMRDGQKVGEVVALEQDAAQAAAVQKFGDGVTAEPTNDMLVSLLKGADLSTALHEGAHFFFENDIALAAELVREQVNPETQNEGALQILADVSALMNFHGITGTIEEQLATWYGLDFEQKRTAHERVAESFEAYLFDGNAPSVELAPYFQRFREWMLSVYKSLKDFLTQNPEAGKLDDTVRGVFDRMLATREQIEMAQAARSMMPLFASPEQGGFTVPEFQAYQEMARQSGDAAADEMEARALRDMAYSRNARGRELKRLQREAAALRSEARIEARRQVMNQPVYRAWQFLKGRLSKDDRAALKQQEVKATTGLNVETDSLFVAIAKLGGLDRGSVERMWGWDAKERSPQPAFGQPLLRREGGLSVDAMGERLAEVGYLTEDGTSDFMAEFEEKFSAEYRGDLQYSMSYDYAQSMERRAGDNIAPGQLSAGRIDLASLKDMALPPAIAERLEELGMTARDGLHPDVAVDMIPGINTEFSNGEQLVRALAKTPDIKEAIEELTDRMMMEQHGELATPEAIERAADLAIHNEVRARLVASELNAIHRMAGKPKILATAAKDYAGKMINRLMLASVKPHLYAAAKARAARASEKAFKTGDLQAAAVEKRNELINAYAAVAAKDALAEARATVKYFNSLTKGGDKKTVQRGMDPDVLNAARFILGAYGVGERSAERAADYLDVLRRNNPDMFKVLEPSITATLANARPLEQMTIEQMRGLREEIEAMAHLAKRSRMMEVGGNLLDREEVVAELDAKLEEIGVPEVIPGEKSAITPMEKAKSSLQYAGAILRRVEQWAEAKDGAFGGPFLRYVFQPVKEAADRYRADRSKYRKAYLDLVKGIAPSMKAKLIEAPELGYTFGQGHNGVGMAELLHVILHTGNESNKRKLLLGGRGPDFPWATQNPDGTLNTGRLPNGGAGWDAFIARMHSEGILRKEHYDFAQGVWDLLDSMKPAAQKTHRDVFGMYFEEITAAEFNTPYGTYRGGYVPAQADPGMVKDAAIRELAEQENQSMAYSFPTTSKGFTKARVEYNRPLKLDLRSLSQHIDKVLLFTHMEPAVRDVNRVITDKGLSGKLARVDPAAIDGMLAPWLKRSATQQVETPIAGDGGVSRVLSTIRSRAGMALMFGNISNTLQQITGLPGAAAKVRPGLLAKATASYMVGPKAMAESVAQSSAYMKNRMENEVAAIHNQMSEILLDPSYLEKAQAWTMKHAYFLQSAFDNVIGPIVWTGAYNQALQDGMPDVDAVRFADGVVRQTQGTTLPEDVSRIETGPAYARLFTQFIGYFNMLANTNASELQKVMRETGIKKGATKALGIVFFGLLAPAWIAEAIAIAMRGGPEDDDDDGYLDDWLMQVAGLGTVKFALAGVPFVGQFANAGINRWNGNPVDDRVSLSPGVSLAEGAVGAPYSVYQAMVNDGNASKAVKDVGTAVSLMTGLPAHWAARPIGYMTGIAEERIEPEGPLDVLRGLVTGVASPESRQ